MWGCRATMTGVPDPDASPRVDAFRSKRLDLQV
jgi:hypothetical protein